MWRRLRTMLAGTMRRTRGERDMADELEFHLDARAADLVRRGGLSSDEARRQARIEFGAVESWKDRCRDERRWHIGDELRADLRYAGRLLVRSPGFSFVIIATLAIAIGANTAVFSVIDGVLLRPLPYPDPARLVKMYETPPPQLDTGSGSVSYLNYLDWCRLTRSFSGLAIVSQAGGSLASDRGAERIRITRASANLFEILGVAPAIGRAFTPEEDRENGAHAAIISFDRWRTLFAQSPQVLGQTIHLDGESYEIVGVLPPGFSFPRPADVMVPISSRRDPGMHSREIHGGLHVVARLAPGVSVQQAQTEMDRVARGLAKIYPKTNEGWGIQLLPLLDDIVGDVRPTLFLLLGAVGLVLLIACSNVANLLLSRAETRRTEFALRTALGAGGPRLIRQLMAESLLLGAIGGSLGLLLASSGTRLLLRQLPVTIPRAADIGFDLRIAAFTGLAIVLTSFLFGLAPAVHTMRVDLQRALKAVTRTTSGGSRARSVFVIVQLALALVLIVATGLLLRTLVELAQVDPGFSPDHVTTVQIALPPAIARDPARTRTTLREYETRFAQIPGVQAASFALMLPLAGDDNEIPYSTTPDPVDTTHSPFTLMYVVTPGYFDTLRIPLRRGRFFTWDDANRDRVPVVIDEALARTAFRDEDPIGKSINLLLLGQAEVVGVAGHVKHWGLDVDDAARIREEIYIPYAAIPDPYLPLFTNGSHRLVLRSPSDPAQLVRSVQEELRQHGSDQPVYGLQTLRDMIGHGTARRRFLAVVLGLFASIALGLAAIGIYGVISYAVTQRTREIGLRMALGASAREVFRLVVGQGARLALAGIIAGVVAAALLMRFLSTLLYGVTATDPLTFAAVAVLLAGIALAACAVPALRAVRIEPTAALRQD